MFCLSQVSLWNKINCMSSHIQDINSLAISVYTNKAMNNSHFYISPYQEFQITYRENPENAGIHDIHDIYRQKA